jgi:hypothetical protein
MGWQLNHDVATGQRNNDKFFPDAGLGKISEGLTLPAMGKKATIT